MKKEEILKLRIEGKSYNEIRKITGVSKSTISFHCKNHQLNERIDGKGKSRNNAEEIKNFYKTHTLAQTSEQFNIGLRTIIRLCERKNRKLTEEERKNYRYANVKSQRKKYKERAIDYKGGECEMCGYNKCINALEFHHLDPDNKIFTLSQNFNKAWNKIEKELNKCILLCSNCHKELHWQLSNLFNIEEQNKWL